MPEPTDPRTRTHPDAVAAQPTHSGDTQPVPAPRPTAVGPGLSFLAPPQAEGELGRLGHYRVLRELGRGGMGLVLLAEDTRLMRPVALKVMLPKFAADPLSKERFLREARAAAQVRHDHVVTIHQVDEDRGVPFIAMEYLQGMPLDAFLKTRGVPEGHHVLRIGREVAEGLAAAHERGLVHRDVKPANIWLEAPSGRVKLLDFGLARQEKDDGHLTGSGAVVGTPAFMSPEQGRGQKVDHRSDLFSLGGVLYMLCTGRTPFTGTTQMALLTSLAVDRPIPVRERNSSVPPALSDLIDRLLAKRPEDRPQSAREVVQMLRTIERPPTPGPAPAVVYVPMAVPVQDEADPWTDIDDDRTIPEPVSSVAAPQPRRTDRTPFYAGLGVAAIALAVIGVVAFKLLDREEPKQPVPEATLDDGKPKPEPKKVGTVTPKPSAVATKYAAPAVRPWPKHLPALVFTPFTAREVNDVRRLWAEYLHRPAEDKTETGLTMILIPPGEFQRGTREGEEGGRANEKPQHKVRLNYPCWVSAHEVTVGQFRQFVNAKGYKTTAEEAGAAATWNNPGFPQTDEHPVTCVSWLDAQAFCDWLSGKEGQIYRLPTSAEWEFCCRAGKVTAYHTGTTIAPTDAHFQAAEGMGTRPVGSYAPNALDLFDLHGNAAEWVRDAWVNYGRWTRLNSGYPAFPGGKGEVRGGSWADGPEALRSAYREEQAVADASLSTGFRVVRELPPEVDLVFQPPLDPDWLKRVPALKGEEKWKEVLAELKRRNPGLDEKAIRAGFNKDREVSSLLCDTPDLGDLMPLRALTRLTNLTVSVQGAGWEATALHDLSPLRGTGLTWLASHGNGYVTDLRPLRGLPLQTLLVTFSSLEDLTPLRGMQLRTLNCMNSGVRDLSPLRGMPFESIDIGGWSSSIHDLSPLKDAPLKAINLCSCAVRDLGPLRGKRIEALSITEMPKLDLSPLTDTPLITFNSTDPEDYAEFLRGKAATLKTVNGQPAAQFFKAIEGGGLDRRAATWALKAGGTVAIRRAKVVTILKPGEELPEGRFELTDINLNGCADITNESLENLRGLRYLEGLNLSGTKVTEASSTLLQSLVRLKRLHLYHLEVTDAWLGRIKNLKLESLGLYEGQVSDVGLAHLTDMPLKHLSFAGPGITDDGMDLVAQIKDFQTLGVGGNQITDAGLLRLPAFPGLTTLTLHSAKMTDRVTEYIERLTQIASLRLEGVKLTDLGLGRIGKVKTLKQINLYRTQVTATGVKAFRKERPDCELTVDRKPAAEWLMEAEER